MIPLIQDDYLEIGRRNKKGGDYPPQIIFSRQEYEFQERYQSAYNF